MIVTKADNKISIVPKLRASATAVSLVLLSTVFVACSEDKSPPDDGDGRKAAAKTQSACDAASLSACAEEVLALIPLTSSEKESLASCDSQSARASESASDLFESARAAVRAECRR